VIHVYRQLKKLGKDHVFGLAENDLERDVPLPEWAAAATRMHVTGIPAPRDRQRGRKRYVTTRKEGPPQLRHYYASVMLTDGVSVRELAEYLGHHDPAFTPARLQSFDAGLARPGPAGDRRPHVPPSRCRWRNSHGIGAR
jgi:integrase